MERQQEHFTEEECNPDNFDFTFKNKKHKNADKDFVRASYERKPGAIQKRAGKDACETEIYSLEEDSVSSEVVDFYNQLPFSFRKAVVQGMTGESESSDMGGVSW